MCHNPAKIEKVEKRGLSEKVIMPIYYRKFSFA
jgi:hypothetical protein